MKSLELIVLSCAVFAACASDLEDPNRFRAPRSSDGADGGGGAGADGDAAVAEACPGGTPPVLSSTTCAGAGCHAATAPAAGLDLASPDLEGRLTGKEGTTGALLVDPSAPAESVLYKRLLPDAALRMPPGPDALDDATVECVKTWIASLPAAAPVDAPGTTVVRVVAGRSTDYTDTAGNAWSADKGFIGGASEGAGTAPIAKTDDPELYRSGRYAGTETVPDKFGYAFDVTPGSYRVTLKFAETYRDAPGQRKFDVTINGAKVLTGFDVIGESGGKFTAIDKSFAATPANGKITIELAPSTPAVFNPMVKAVEIVPSS